MNGAGEMDEQNQSDEVTPPELKAIQDVMSNQQVLFSEQLTEMHRLIGLHKDLAGMDPISGEKVHESRESQKQQPQLPSSEDSEEEVPSSVKSRKRRHEDEGPSRPRSDSAGEKGKTSRKTAASESSAPVPKADLGEDSKEPTKLEADLSRLLGSQGIATVDGIVDFVVLLKEHASTTEAGMTLLCAALIETKQEPLLRKFIELDGLRTLRLYLTQAKLNSYLPLLKLVLQVLQHLPVTVPALQGCDIGKQVNLLKKNPDPDVQESSQRLIDGWKELVRVHETEQKQKQALERELEQKQKPSIDRVPLKKKSEPTVPDIEVEAKRIRMDESGSEPRLVNGDLAKSEADHAADKAEVAGPSSPTEASRPSMQSDSKEKPKQVETKLLQMHDSDIFAPSASSSSQAHKPQKKAEKLKPDHVRFREEKKKLRAGVQQLSSDPQLSEAASATTSAPAAAPIAPPISIPKFTKPPAAVPHRPLSADEIKKQKLLEKYNGPKSPTASSPRAGTAQTSLSPPPAPTAPPPEAKTAGTSEEKAPVQSNAIQSASALEPSVVKSVKRVSWAQGDKLCECIRFNVISTDDEEKPAEVVFDHENFAKGLKLERSRERQVLESEKHKIEDEQKRLQSMNPTTPWRTPPDIDLPEELQFQQGRESEERLKQQAREATVLEAIYLKAASIPDEPQRMLILDKEWDDRLTPIIPLEEVPETPEQGNTPADQATASRTNPQPPWPSNLPEADARLLTSLLQQLGGGSPGPTAPPSSLHSQPPLPSNLGNTDNIDVGALVNTMLSNPAMLADILANPQLSAVILNLIQSHMGQPNAPQNPPLPSTNPNPPLPNMLAPLRMPPAPNAVDFATLLNPGGVPNLSNLEFFSNPLAAFLSGSGPANQNLPPGSGPLMGMLSNRLPNHSAPLPRMHMDAPRGVEQAFHGNPHAAMQQSDVGPGGLGHGMTNMNYIHGMPAPDSPMDGRFGPPDMDGRFGPPDMDGRFGPPDMDNRGGRGFFGKVCYFFNTPSGCRNGDNCPYVHDRNAPPPMGRGRGRPPFRR